MASRRSISETDEIGIVVEEDETSEVSNASEPGDDTGNVFNAADQFQLFTKYMDKKISALKESLQQPKIESKTKDTPKLLKKAHQQQVDFNDEVNRKLTHAKTLLKGGSRKRTAEAIEEAQECIRKRTKLIRIADKSAGGWDTVEAYLPDDIASDSGDEKRIQQAERKALAVRKLKKDYNNRPGPSRGRDPPSNSSYNKGPRRPYGRSVEDDTCMAWGKKGHWKRDCLSKQKPKIRYVMFDPLLAQAKFCERNKVVTGLGQSVNFWARELKASQVVLQTIKEGYEIPLAETPESAQLKNNLSAFQNKRFVDNEINDLVERGVIVETPFVPWVVNPLTVNVNHEGKKRLILDLRFLNQFVLLEHIRFDDWSTFQEYVIPGGWGYKFDLKHGYHHIDINFRFCAYFGFSWKTNGKTKFYVFTKLPFGLNSAAYIFTKVLRPLTKYWRGQGIKIAVYLDDGAGMEKSTDLCASNSEKVRNTLIQAGFSINDKKSVWKPTQVFTWLGVTVNTCDNKYYITAGRILRMQKSIINLLSQRRTSARKLASFAGSIISAKFVFGDITALMTREIFKIIQTSISWDTLFTLDYCTNAIKEISFWEKNLCELNNRPITNVLIPTQITCFSDASNDALGIICGNKKML